MKRIYLFTLTLFTCNCVWAQKPAGDGIIWTTTLTYCINTDELRYDQTGNGFYNLYSIYNLVCKNKQGDLRKTLDELYKGMTTYKWPVFHPDIYNNIAPMQLMCKAETDTASGRVMELMDSSGNMITLLKKYSPEDVAGITLNEEWFYDKNTEKILTTITDASLVVKMVNDAGDLLGMGPIAVFKFSDRSSDSGSNSQLIYKSQISWGKGMNMRLLYDSIKGISLDQVHDTICFNGSAAYGPFPGNTIPIKTTFNKRLVELIFDAVMKGQLAAYKCIDNGDIGEKMTTPELQSATSYIYQIASYDDDGTAASNKIVTTKYSDYDLTGLEIVQEISFNEKTFRFETKIIRAAVIANKRDRNGGSNCTATLFWVKFE